MKNKYVKPTIQKYLIETERLLVPLSGSLKDDIVAGARDLEYNEDQYCIQSRSNSVWDDEEE